MSKSFLPIAMLVLVAGVVWLGWGRGVTVEGADHLGAALPGLEINLGATMRSASAEGP